MGIIEKGINGPFKGKAGSVVGSSWKKINYIKGLRRVTSKKHTASPEQAIQQRKFQLLNGFLRPLKTILKVGFQHYTDKSTAVNAAFRFNYDHAFSIAGEEITLNYGALHLSQGTLYTAGAETAHVEDDGIRITWSPKTFGMGGDLDDVAYAIICFPTEDLVFSNDQTAIREDGATHIPFNRLPDGGDVHVWLFFTDKQRKRVSKTIYIPLSGSNP